VVSDVQVEPQVGRVLIRYHLAHPDNASCDVSVEVSSDGGASFNFEPSALIGDIGVVQATAEGDYHEIIWHPAEDGLSPGDNYTARVIADDHEIPLIDIDMEILQGAPGTILNFSTSVPLEDFTNYTISFGDTEVRILPAGSSTSFATSVPMIPAGPVEVVIKENDVLVSYDTTFNVLPPPVTYTPPGSIARSVIQDNNLIIQGITDEMLPVLQQSGILTVNNAVLLQEKMGLFAEYQMSVMSLLDDLPDADKLILDQVLLSSGLTDRTSQLRELTLASSAKYRDPDTSILTYLPNGGMLLCDLISAALSDLIKTYSLVSLVVNVSTGGVTVIVSVVLTAVDKLIDGFIPTDLEYLYVEGNQPMLVPLGGTAPLNIMGRFSTQSAPSNVTLSFIVGATCTALGLDAAYSFIIGTMTDLGIAHDENIGIDEAQWQFDHAREYPVCPPFYYNVDYLSDYIYSNYSLNITDIPIIGSLLGALPQAEYGTENHNIAQINLFLTHIIGNALGSTSLVYNGFRFISSSQYGDLGVVADVEYPELLIPNLDTVPCMIQVMAAEPNQISIDSYPPGADIFVNGLNTGMLTPANIPFQYEGIHPIRIAKQGYNDYCEEVVTEFGESYMIHAVLSNHSFPRPVIQVETPENDYTAYLPRVVISGRILLEDAFGCLYNYTGDQLFANINGSETRLSVDNGRFFGVVYIDAGVNNIYLRCVTDGGVSSQTPSFVVNGEFDQTDSMVLVQGGEFIMGNTLDHPLGGNDELPIHQVVLPPYFIGKYEVTQSEYEEVMEYNPSHTMYGLGDFYPVNEVSWYAAIKYCNLRSIKEGYTPVYSINDSTDPDDWGSIPSSFNVSWDSVLWDINADGYRLPTEAEWEYAARGGDIYPDYLYSGSDDLYDVGWCDAYTYLQGFMPVGTRNPNQLQIFDMSGNAWEWCWDRYGHDYYDEAQPYDPSGPTTGSSRVYRGGSSFSSAADCRVTNREFYFPYMASVPMSCGFGLRVCRSVMNDICIYENFDNFIQDNYHVSGNAYLDTDEGHFVLTPPINNNRGRLYALIPFIMDSFEVEFDFRIGGGSGADGLIFAWVPDYAYAESYGGLMDFSSTSGYGVEFDVHYNSTYQDVSEEHIALVWDTAAGHLSQTAMPNNSIENNIWHHARIQFNFGFINVFMDGVLYLEYYIPNYSPFMGYFGFTAATGDANHFHRIDNISISN